MLYADDAGVVSRFQEGLTRMMTLIVEVFGAFGLTVSEKKTETPLMRAPEKQPKKGGSPPPPLVIEATGQKYAQTAQFRFLGDLVNEGGELTQEINHRSKAAWACMRKFSRELFDRPRAPWRLKVGTTASHSELTEPYGPLQRRCTMGRRGTRGCCRERKKS